MSGSTVPAAIDALLAAFTAAAPDGWNVIDGPPLDAGSKFLCVAHDDIEESAAVSADVTPADMRRTTNQEVYSIRCVLMSWAGIRSQPSANRAAIFTAYETFTAALPLQLPLGAGLAKVTVDTFDHQQVLGEPGRGSAIRFSITVEAWK